VKSLLVLISVAVFALVCFGKPAVAAPDLCQVAAADTCHVLLDNDQVRVIHYISKAGSKVPMHTHPNHVVYLLTDTNTQYTMPDGSKKDISGKKGEAKWVAAGDHASQNIGTTDGEVLVIELKGSGMMHH
jgi:hypothetical protein